MFVSGAKVDLCAHGVEYVSPLIACCLGSNHVSDRLRIVKLLINVGINLGLKVHQIIKNSSVKRRLVDIVQFLIDVGADVL